MFDQEQEERDYFPDSPYAQCCYMAQVMGEDKPDHAWLLTDMDTWIANPFYKGPPQTHPEDYQPE